MTTPSYTEQTWVNGSGGGTPLSQDRLTHIEDGIAAAMSRANAAYTLAGSASGGTVTTTPSSTDGDWGVVPFDSFAGANDEAKLTAAISAIGADTYHRTLVLTNRSHSFSTSRAVPFPGFKIQGPGGYSNADKGANYMTAQVALSMSGPWWHNNGTNAWDMSLRGLAFTGGSGATVVGQSGGGSWWRLHMRDISASGLKSVAGTQATPILLTGAFWDGFWEINNSYSGAFHIGGSDNRLFMNGGFLDSDPAFNSGAAGQAHLWLDYCENTTVGSLYITCEGPWAAVHVSGPAFGSTSDNQGGEIDFFGTRAEGRNANQPCYGAPVRVDGGIVSWTGGGVSFGMSSPASMGHSPADAGMIHHAGGTLNVDKVTYDRATGVGESTPFVYTASTGDCIVKGVRREYRGGTWTQRPLVSLKSGVAENRIVDATVRTS